MITTLEPENLSPEFKTHFNITDVHSVTKGGQKIVFIVTKDNIRCALKLFHNFNKRDIRELGIYEKFKHLNGIPKIISVEDFGNDKVVFEEYIDGSNLDDIVKDYIGDWNKIRKLIMKICLILEPIWKDNKIHRDIKPKNIMIRKDGTPVVIDFGIGMTPEIRTPIST